MARLTAEEWHAQVVRDKLAKVAQARWENDEETARITDLIRLLVWDARAAGIPMTEVAEILGINRTNLYRTYLRE